MKLTIRRVLVLVVVYWMIGGAVIGGFAVRGRDSEAAVKYIRPVPVPLAPSVVQKSEPGPDPLDRLRARLDKQHRQVAALGKFVRSQRALVRKQHRQIHNLGEMVREERRETKKAGSRTIRVSRLMSFAKRAVGTPYVWGGDSYSDGGFDCSGLVIAAYRAANIVFDHRMTTWSVRSLGRAISRSQLMAGDVVVTGTGGHMVLYAGGGRVISAPHTGALVKWDWLSNYNVVDTRRLF